jgi:hypothetical protein
MSIPWRLYKFGRPLYGLWDIVDSTALVTPTASAEVAECCVYVAGVVELLTIADSACSVRVGPGISIAVLLMLEVDQSCHRTWDTTYVVILVGDLVELTVSRSIVGAVTALQIIHIGAHTGNLFPVAYRVQSIHLLAGRMVSTEVANCSCSNEFCISSPINQAGIVVLMLFCILSDFGPFFGFGFST